MPRNHPTTRTAAGLAVTIALIVLACTAVAVMGQEKAGPPVDPPESVTIRPIGPHFGPVTFAHKTHNDYVDNGCASCHHKGLENFDFSCSGCHRPDEIVTEAGKPAALKRAYHIQCVGCHKSLQVGPVACTGCHAKNPPAKPAPTAAPNGEVKP